MAELTFAWERSAMEGAEMPEGLSPEEQLAWQALAHLYGRYRMKLISREGGHLEKGKIRYALDMRMRQANMDRRLAEHHAALLKSVEGAASAYAKERTLENADRLYRAVYGLMPNK